MNTLFRFSPRGRELLQQLDLILDAAYEAPEHLLGNRSDPLDEAAFIILSFQTDLARLKATWANLKTAFPRWADLERASLSQVAGVLRTGGLHRQKAKTIKRLLHAVGRDFRELSLDMLHSMNDSDAERTLQGLPGLSWKGSRCVLLYSLGRQVFPIDGNSFRILQRTGVIPRTAVYRRLSLHNCLQEAVAPDRRRRFHVNLVVHGQMVCLPLRPDCARCAVVGYCPRRGLPPLQTVPRTTKTIKAMTCAVQLPRLAQSVTSVSTALCAAI